MNKVYLVRRHDSFKVYYAFIGEEQANTAVDKLNADLDDLRKAIESCGDTISFKSERIQQTINKYYVDEIPLQN